MSEIRIRKLQKKDAAGIGKIYSAITNKPCDLDFKRIVAEEVRREVDVSYVAEMDGKVVAYMISYITCGNFGADRSGWISMFGVDPKLMGQGLGRKLADRIFDVFREEGITEVLTSVKWDSTDVLSFFKALDFSRSEFVNLQKTLE